MPECEEDDHDDSDACSDSMEVCDEQTPAQKVCHSTAQKIPIESVSNMPTERFNRDQGE